MVAVIVGIIVRILLVRILIFLVIKYHKREREGDYERMNKYAEM